jgi:hypothetical protein
LDHNVITVNVNPNATAFMQEGFCQFVDAAFFRKIHFAADENAAQVTP